MKKNFWQATAQSKKLIFFLFLFPLSLSVWSQTVSGTVSDGDRRLVAEATVQVKGTTRSTITNEAGRFTVNAAPNEVLVISNIDFAIMEVPVNRRQSISIVLGSNDKDMENVNKPVLN